MQWYKPNKMRNKLLLIVFAGAVLLSSFKIAADYTKASAVVNQVEGIYVYTDCKPVLDYEYIGTIKSSFAGTGQYYQVRNKLLKKCKKEYPNADAIVIRFNTNGVDKADVIKFK